MLFYFLGERDMNLKCLKCGSGHAVKNGFIFGRQRYKCKRCGYQYTKIKPSGHSEHEKKVVAILYASGLSMNMIAQMMGVSVQSISRWVRTFCPEKAKELPEMEVMKKVKLKRMLRNFQKMNAEEREYEVFLLSTRLPSGCAVKIFVDNPLNLKNRKEQQDCLMTKFFSNG